MPASLGLGDLSHTLSNMGATNLSQNLLRCAMMGPIEGALDRFRQLSPLPEDAHRIIDDIVVRVGPDRMPFVKALMDAGLVTPIPEWLGVTEIGSDDIDEVGVAHRTMIPKARGERAVPKLSRNMIPVFCTWSDFSYDIRTLLAGRRVGRPIETLQIEMAVRRDNEAIEDQAWNGLDFNVRGNTAPGIASATSTAIVPFIDNESWTASGHSGEDIFNDTQNMIQALVDRGFPGPFALLLPSSFGIKLGSDYKAQSTTSIRARLQELSYGGKPLQILESTKTTASGDQVALVQMTHDVVDVAVGQQPMPLSWSDGPGFEWYFIVLACMIFRLRKNSLGYSGVAIGRPEAL